MRGLAAAAVLLCMAASPAAAKSKTKRKPAPAAAAATFSDPHALDAFFTALASTEDGSASTAVRISFLGDSLVANDEIAERLRVVLGKQFGDGGPGFVQAAKLPSQHHRAVKRIVGGGWKAFGIAGPSAKDRLYGFGGSSAESKGSGRVRFKLDTNDGVRSAVVYYLQQPGGGELEVVVDGKVRATIETRHTAKKVASIRVASDTAIADVQLRTRGKVRVFGTILEGPRGVVVDNLGVKNATAKAWNKNRSDHWRGQIGLRKPDLFVVMIGSNEAWWLAGKSLKGYQAVMEALLAPVRAGHPNGSCLVISPLDQVDFEQTKLPQRRTIEPMVEAQRKAAAAAGCAFWDAYTWMGGARSSLTWFKQGWMNNDFAHPTSSGDKRIGDALAAGLLAGYATHRKGGTR